MEQITKKLLRATGEALEQFSMIEAGDRIMVCLSGGKDSYTMLDMMLHFQKVAPISFDIIAVNLDQKQPGFPVEVLPTYLSNLGVDYKIIEKNTYKVVMEKTPEGKTTCSLCSRLRRGTLYEAAKNLNCNKLALGHHRNDIIETFLLNFFFAGKLESMPPKFRNDAGNLVILRPLALCKEEDIEVYSEYMNFPIIPCNLCGSQENLQRKKVKQMIADWETDFPDRTSVMMNALQNVSPSHLLDRKIYDFSSLQDMVSKDDALV
ncbi:tRNA 2-thiocytidine(32) synthetase TtcA [Mariniflexile litorale]|uniref:tRNA-cytidine(32) 2-sulfurtransferase n=1 Tax=Mariniflexile litorale TaxID=3045158 RepID=A0AAU7EDQ0_9FLAO|nr:tRNA 2-thiocytidine(32) synthetase TtcA [Mariniflexile sp. KMM 9835]MDQ8212243.1 tRNA 2-thiocytidine(32) synthetase TtcA [Mariniflexile sp. KMM 9835]